VNELNICRDNLHHQTSTRDTERSGALLNDNTEEISTVPLSLINENYV